MLAQILTGKLIGEAGGSVGERQHRLGAQPVRNRVRESSPARHSPPRPCSERPGGVAVSGPDCAAAAVPYGLIAPGRRRDRASSSAIRSTGSSSSRLERYGLFELIRHQGVSGRARELPLRPARPGLLAHAAPHGRLHGGRTSTLTMGIGMLLALLLVARQHRRCASCSARGSCSSGRCRSSSPCRSGTG